MYLDASELKTEIAISRATGCPTNRLIELFGTLANGVLFTFGRGLDFDDMRQDILIALLAVLPKVNLKRSPKSIFSYLTECGRMVLNAAYRKEEIRKRNMAKYGVLKFGPEFARNWSK